MTMNKLTENVKNAMFLNKNALVINTKV